MTRRCSWILILAMVGCGAPEDTDPPPLDRPDAGPTEPVRPICEFDSCGLPGDDPCCTDTVCVDWAQAGPTECAAECESNDDCASGCCRELSNGQTTCAPEGVCDAGGSFPEIVCDELVDCGQAGSFAQCVASMTACVGELSNDEQRQWIDAMIECGSVPEDNVCNSNYTYCWLNYVPWC